MSARTLYRFECACGKHGRWLSDPNLASVFGERHEDRRHLVNGEPIRRARLKDTSGRDHGYVS